MLRTCLFVIIPVLFGSSMVVPAQAEEPAVDGTQRVPPPQFFEVESLNGAATLTYEILPCLGESMKIIFANSSSLSVQIAEVQQDDKRIVVQVDGNKPHKVRKPLVYQNMVEWAPRRRLLHEIAKGERVQIFYNDGKNSLMFDVGGEFGPKEPAD